MMMNNLRPTEITANRPSRKLIIDWNDGHQSTYPFSLLRHACPCASCRGGHEAMSPTPDPIVFSLPDEDTPATRLTNLEAVGAYVLMITWEDGHNYGIYTWNYLRLLCPCPVCQADRSS
jgi:DUF971 family protein